MRSSTGLVSIAALLLMVSAAQAADQPAAQKVTPEDAARQQTVAALQAKPSGASSSEQRARSALAWGDNFSAANLMERAVAERGTVTERFNLAAAYTKTGRYAEAAALYRVLVTEGEFTVVELDPNYVQGVPGSHRVKVSSEAAKRLKTLDRLLPAGQASAAAPFSAAQAGVNAVAITPAAKVSDEQAIALDAELRAARVSAAAVVEPAQQASSAP